MLIADKLVFVSLHKQGVGPVKRLLEQVLGGETRKEDAPPSELLALNRPVVGFVCHPMAWYLALWRQGCEGKGGVHRRLTDATRWQRAGTDRPAAWSAEYAKRAWYGRGDLPEAFREWLLAVLGTPALRRVVDVSATPAQALWLGLMTRDYLRAYVPEAQPGEPGPGSLADLQRHDAQRSLARHMIRAERASEDMAALMRALGLTLSAEQQQALAKLTRRVSHSSDWAEFYDAASRQLLARHEPFMLARWGYDVLPLAAPAKAPGRPQAPAERAARQAQKRAARAAASREGSQSAAADAAHGAERPGASAAAETAPSAQLEAAPPAVVPSPMAPEPVAVSAPVKPKARAGAKAKAPAQRKTRGTPQDSMHPPAPEDTGPSAPARKAKAQPAARQARQRPQASLPEAVAGSAATGANEKSLSVAAQPGEPVSAQRASPKSAARRAGAAQAAKPAAATPDELAPVGAASRAKTGSKGAAPKRASAKAAQAPARTPEPGPADEGSAPEAGSQQSTRRKGQQRRTGPGG